ncbi:hypothetical protein [Steroidobacter cummioxidans]|uniref:hypothetical protein n=1 Tax=Steroidobacter cummioxidans TaxID=1803913 RepID=UPI00137A8267|nr:hypothetical protein [Steroidobacter cummioxidans]
MALCTTCVLTACAGDGSGLDENGRPVTESGGGTLQPNFQSIQDNVFTPVCTVCHAGAAAPLGLRLDEGSSYALLVNASSVEVPSLHRVEPGNPDSSYLIQKLEGIAAVGGRMPLNQPPLPQETIAVIRQWITDGAQNSTGVGGSAKSRFEMVKLTAISPGRNEIVPAPVRDVIITSNVELDTSLLQSNLIELRASGGDGNFDSGNEREVPVDATVRSDLPTVLAITPRLAPLAADSYELRISGTDPVAMADMRALPIDGDGDGAPGGDFVLRFTVEMTQ